MSQISRKKFLKGAAAGALGVAALGMAGAVSAVDGEAQGGSFDPLSDIPSFMIPPAAPETVAAEHDCEVLVVGGGMSGLAALYAAAEEGAKVIGIDRGAGVGYVPMTGDFGIVGSKIHEQLNFPWASRGEVINELMKDMGYRPNPLLLGYWYDHSGQDFDWAVEGVDYQLLESSIAEPKQELFIRPKLFPALEGYDWKEEFYPYFHGSVTTYPSAEWVLENMLSKAQALGAEYIDNMRGELLIQDESGRVVGAYAKDPEGNYHRFNAAKGVVLCCGDISSNKEMLQYYCPEGARFFTFYGRRDGEGNPCNTGDGHRMALYAGAAMEIGPFAPMTHHGGGALGLAAFLQLNAKGRRFMNEDVPGQTLQNQLARQPYGISWQVFDDKWREQLPDQGTGHGFVNHHVSAEAAAEMPWVFEGYFMGYTTDEMFNDRVTVTADTIEELAEKMELPVETVKAEVARYNELAEKGLDEDFGKMPKRLKAIDKPPYYACKLGQTSMLVCPGGIKVDTDCHALTEGDEPVPGLYMAGNTMGGRFACEYPVTVAGISLSSALTFGRLAGGNAAKGI